MNRPNLDGLAGSISRKPNAGPGRLIAAVTGTHPDSAPISDVAPHPNNIRTDLEDLTELVDSITSQGIIQPLVVIPAADYRQHNPDAAPIDAAWVVIAGHRRLAAAQQAGLVTVPITVRPALAEPAKATTAMLVENMQRDNLNPLDEAEGLKSLADTGMSQREIAEAVGITQGTVSKRLKLLDLTDAGREALRTGRLGVADALDLLTIPETHRDSVLKAGLRAWNMRRAITRYKQQRDKPLPGTNPKPSPRPSRDTATPADTPPEAQGSEVIPAESDTDEPAREQPTPGPLDIAWPTGDGQLPPIAVANQPTAADRIDNLTTYLAAGARPGAGRLLADLVLALGPEPASMPLVTDLLSLATDELPEATSQTDATRQAIAAIAARLEARAVLGGTTDRYLAALRRAGILEGDSDQ